MGAGHLDYEFGNPDSLSNISVIRKGGLGRRHASPSKEEERSFVLGKI
jgi:hypothetical protein